jgi:hypothetical protein
MKAADVVVGLGERVLGRTTMETVIDPVTGKVIIKKG